MKDKIDIVRLMQDGNLNALADLRDQLREELAAVEKVLTIAKRRWATNGSPAALGPAHGNSKVETKKAAVVRLEYGAVGKSVLEALKSCPEQFAFSDVEKVLSEKLNLPLQQQQVSLALNRLIKAQKIAVIKPRYGRTPAVYKKM